MENEEVFLESLKLFSFQQAAHGEYAGLSRQGGNKNQIPPRSVLLLVSTFTHNADAH